MIYLIGVWHKVQFWNGADCKYKQKDIDKFSLHLNDKAKKHDIIMIGEEFSAELMKLNNATHCTAQDIAAKLGIMHKWCESKKQERPKDCGELELLRFREEYWFKQISDLADKSIIFICGNKHLESFPKVIEAAGFKAEILSRDWGSDLEHKIALNIED